MIKLVRPDKPSELTEDVEKELVEEYKATKKDVWRQDYIVTPLLKMSNEKCCYCETELETQAKPMHVEHYHCKNLYPDEVVSWGNLLPSCSQCNSNKGTLDTYKTPIIDPTVDNPKDYLYLNNYMIRSKDNTIGSKGWLTVDRLDLNNRKRLVNTRIKIADEMRKKLEDAYKKASALALREDGKLYNKSVIIRTLRDILEMAQQDAEYSAFMATIILTDDDYLAIKNILQEKNIWTDELDKLHNAANEIKLDTTK